MKMAKNRERILEASVTLFNESGVAAVSTNHIAEYLGISPGNLYFHFSNKEAIVRELFEHMCEKTYTLWNSEENLLLTPLALLERSLDLFWAYRFFHREMYHLRRKDPLLARKWRAHLIKTERLLQARYIMWVRAGVMRRINDPAEMRMVADVVLITSSASLQFFESYDKPASRKAVRHGVRHLTHLLLPYHTETAQREIRERLI